MNSNHQDNTEAASRGRDMAEPQAPGTGGAQASGAGAQQAGAAGPTPTSSLEEKLAALQAERDELYARLQRVSADYQNYVRRSAQGVNDACDQQLMKVARALLVPMDHFDQALSFDPQKTTAQSLLEGVQIVRDELYKTLEQFGVRRLEVTPGDRFDPARHEAVTRIPAEGLSSEQVAAQLQPGYLVGDRTLRPAKVAVAQ
jgi:molecular chaperone GrpE